MCQFLILTIIDTLWKTPSHFVWWMETYMLISNEYKCSLKILSIAFLKGSRHNGYQCPPLDPNDLTPTWANSLTPGHEVSPVNIDQGWPGDCFHASACGPRGLAAGADNSTIPDPIPQCLYTGFLIPGSMMDYSDFRQLSVIVFVLQIQILRSNFTQPYCDTTAL